MRLLNNCRPSASSLRSAQGRPRCRRPGSGMTPMLSGESLHGARSYGPKSFGKRAQRGSEGAGSSCRPQLFHNVDHLGSCTALRRSNGIFYRTALGTTPATDSGDVQQSLFEPTKEMEAARTFVVGAGDGDLSAGPQLAGNVIPQEVLPHLAAGRHGETIHDLQPLGQLDLGHTPFLEKGDDFL